MFVCHRITLEKAQWKAAWGRPALVFFSGAWEKSYRTVFHAGKNIGALKVLSSKLFYHFTF